VVYEVQVEDTLSSLADRYDMSVQEIVDANCLTRRVISAGQLLYFPPLETATPEPSITVTEALTITTGLSPTACIPPEGWTVLYAVQAGDSLYSLALTYGVTAEEIVAANCLESTLLSADGQQLYLPPLPEGSSFPEGSDQQFSEDVARTTPVPLGTASASVPAPVLIAPDDGAESPARDEIVLAWQPVPRLPADGYYVITVAYSHQGETWYDEVPWTRDTSWTLSDHGYLLSLSDDGQFTWGVQVMRQTGIGADGSPEGEALSDPSAWRRLIWNLPSSGGGGTRTGTPPVPPP
jgi:LysM repeat protein